MYSKIARGLIKLSVLQMAFHLIFEKPRLLLRRSSWPEHFKSVSGWGLQAGHCIAFGNL